MRRGIVPLVLLALWGGMGQVPAYDGRINTGVRSAPPAPKRRKFKGYQREARRPGR